MNFSLLIKFKSAFRAALAALAENPQPTAGGRLIT